MDVLVRWRSDVGSRGDIFWCELLRANDGHVVPGAFTGVVCLRLREARRSEAKNEETHASGSKGNTGAKWRLIDAVPVDGPLAISPNQLDRFDREAALRSCRYCL